MYNEKQHNIVEVSTESMSPHAIEVKREVRALETLSLCFVVARTTPN